MGGLRGGHPAVTTQSIFEGGCREASPPGRLRCDRFTTFQKWDTEHASTRTHTRQAGACTLMLAHTRPTAGVPRTHVFTHMQLEITSLLIDGLLLVNRNGISVTHIETDMFNDSRTSRKVEVIRSYVLDSGGFMFTEPWASECWYILCNACTAEMQLYTYT